MRDERNTNTYNCIIIINRKNWNPDQAEEEQIRDRISNSNLNPVSFPKPETSIDVIFERCQNIENKDCTFLLSIIKVQILLKLKFHTQTSNIYLFRMHTIIVTKMQELFFSVLNFYLFLIITFRFKMMHKYIHADKDESSRYVIDFFV